MAKTARARLNQSLLEQKDSSNKTDPKIIEEYKEKFMDAVQDDVNAPLALGILFTAIKEPKSKDIYNLALEFDKFFGLSFDKIETKEEDSIPDEIVMLAASRAEAKKVRDFSKADAIRNEIEAKGYLISDTREGYTIKKKD